MVVRTSRLRARSGRAERLAARSVWPLGERDEDPNQVLNVVVEDAEHGGTSGLASHGG